MALRLTASRRCIDRCGGIADIAARRVRVLHDASFHRRRDAHLPRVSLRRAARLRDRRATRGALIRARRRTTSSTIGGERLRRELELMLREACGGAALEAVPRSGALARRSGAGWDRRRSDGARGALAARCAARAVRLRAAGRATRQPTTRSGIVERLRLTRDEAAAVRGVAAMRALRRDAAAAGCEAVRRRRAARPLSRRRGRGVRGDGGRSDCRPDWRFVTLKSGAT